MIAYASSVTQGEPGARTYAIPNGNPSDQKALLEQQEKAMLMQLKKVSQEQALLVKPTPETAKNATKPVSKNTSELFSAPMLSKYLGLRELPKDVDIVEASVGINWLGDLKAFSNVFGKGKADNIPMKLEDVALNADFFEQTDPDNPGGTLICANSYRYLEMFAEFDIAERIPSAVPIDNGDQNRECASETFEAEIKELGALVDDIYVTETEDDGFFQCKDGPVIVNITRRNHALIIYLRSRGAYTLGLRNSRGVGFDLMETVARRGVTRIRVLKTDDDVENLQRQANEFLDASNAMMSGFVQIRDVVGFFWPEIVK